MKPENFVIGREHKSLIYLIDFGLAKTYINKHTNKHIPLKVGKKLTGTARYVSISTHQGFEQGRKDDLEGICYIMLHFLIYDLPWRKLDIDDKETKYKQIMKLKMEFQVDVQCKEYPCNL